MEKEIADEISIIYNVYDETGEKLLRRERRSIGSEKAKLWLDKVNGMCMNLQVRGQNPFEHFQPEWEVEEIENFEHLYDEEEN